jgi:hypothetical protein
MHLRSSFALIALIPACGSESEKPHPNAGRRVHECTSVPGSLPRGAGSPRRATWAANLVGSGPSRFDIPVRATWTYAMNGDLVDAPSACVDIEKVPPQLSVQAVISVHNFEHTMNANGVSKPPHVVLDLELVLRAPARVEDDVISNYPEAGYVWRFESHHDSVAAYQFKPLIVPAFQPAWKGTVLTIEPLAISVERASEP